MPAGAVFTLSLPGQAGNDSGQADGGAVRSSEMVRGSTHAA